MNIILRLNAVLILLLISGCDILNTDPDTTPYGNLKITGQVYMQQDPLAGATIQVGDVANWKVSTDDAGKFEIFRVAQGEQEIRIEKYLDDGRVVGQRTRIFLSEQSADLGAFILPQPGHMLPIDVSTVTSNSITIKWERTNDPDFVEYRIYRSTTPDVTELSSEMIYSTKSIDDLEYADHNFRTGIPAYYRVFVFTTYGRYSGSKVESATAPELNLVKNPGFEETSNGTFPDYWLERFAGQPLFRFFSLTAEDKKAGEYSSKITYIESQANPDPESGSWGGIYQHVFTTNMNFNETYTLSFWLKMVTGSVQIRLMKNGDFNQPLLFAEIPAGNDWQQHSLNFNIDQDTRFIEIWMNTKSGLAQGGIVTGYMDDLSIIK